MAEENRLRFVEAMRGLDGPAILELLPHLTLTDLSVVRQYWLNGHLGELDPTNVLSAGDFADQFLNLPEHAVALYDAALEYMDKHPESIADDTDCAAASLNLMDLLAKAGQGRAAVTAARRAARMPVKRAEQNSDCGRRESGRRRENGPDVVPARQGEWTLCGGGCHGGDRQRPQSDGAGLGARRWCCWRLIQD